jgi:hypothetical protein
MKDRMAVILGLAVLLAAAPAFATLVVNYDVASYGTGTLAAYSSGNDGTTWWNQRAFTDPGGTKWSSGAGYTGPALYGGIRGETQGGAKVGYDGYALTPFDIRYQTTTTGLTGRLEMALVFDSGQTGLRFDGTSSLMLGRSGYTTLERFESLADVRWLVRNGSTYYVSQSLIANTTAGLTETSSELAGEMWAVYNPADAAAFSLSLTFDTPSSSLTNLNAFGVMTYKSSFSAVRSWLKFNQFHADAIIPEPATMSLLGLGAMAMLRRKSR